MPISGKLKLMPNGVDAKLVREVIKTEGPDVFKRKYNNNNLSPCL